MFPRKHGKTQHVEIVAKGIEEAIGKWNTLVCARCGRQKTLANIEHTRLYGIMCVCGSQEWKAAKQKSEQPAAEVCPPDRHVYYTAFLSYLFCPYCGVRLQPEDD